MSDPVGNPKDRFSCITAHIISHSEVCIHVLFKISFLVKSFATLATLVGLGSGMRSHMNIQFCSTWETFSANHASMPHVS